MVQLQQNCFAKYTDHYNNSILYFNVLHQQPNGQLQIQHKEKEKNNKNNKEKVLITTSQKTNLNK
jgi:hypothetical protein